MKISGGAAKGIPIHVPKTDGLRPASSSSRERLFSSLGKRVEGAFFLDLFCGSGSYGLEAVSRGAKSGAFVDRDFRATQCVRRNLAQVCKSANRLDDNFEIVTCDVLKWKSRDVGPFDLVFADPPYPLIQEIGSKLFAKLLIDELVGDETLVALELPGEVQLEPEGWRLERRLGKARKGSPSHALYRIR